MFTANPPLRKLSTSRIPHSAALNLISSYLLASTTNPSLHPDALLTESGPLASSTEGLTLHNLRRIEAGLRGDNLGADLTFSKFGGQGLPDLQASAPRPISGTGRRGGFTGEKGAAEVVEGWQDREEFEREQEVVVGGGGRGEEMMKRGKGSGVRVLEEKDDDRPIVGGGITSAEDKDKKRRKKERRRNDRREREKRRQKERGVE